MGDVLARIWEDLAGRVGGPMSFQLILQPAVAVVLAVRAGLGDARSGRPPYFWSILDDPAHRLYLLAEGWKATAMVFVVAVAIYTVYQRMVLGWFYPFEALLVAFALACVPYAIIRGLVTRFARPRRGPESSGV